MTILVLQLYSLIMEIGIAVFFTVSLSPVGFHQYAGGVRKESRHRGQQNRQNVTIMTNLIFECFGRKSAETKTPCVGKEPRRTRQLNLSYNDPNPRYCFCSVLTETARKTPADRDAVSVTLLQATKYNEIWPNPAKCETRPNT